MNNKKEFINIGTIGHVDHGKTTLTSAISTRVSERFGGKAKSYSDIDSTSEERERGITINQTTIKYDTAKRTYSHVDCPGHQDYIKNMIVGASQLDTVIVVVALTDGPMLQTTEHVLLAKRLGIGKMIIFLNKEDMIDKNEIEEQCEIVKYQMLDIFTKFNIDEENVKFITGSGLKSLENDPYYVAKIDELIDAMDEFFYVPERRVNEKLIMTIEGVKKVPGRGNVATGVVQQGRIVTGQEVDVIGLEKDIKNNKVVSLHMFHQAYNEVEAGNNVGVLLRNNEDLQKGQVICDKNYLTSSNTFQGELYALTEEDGGRKTSFGAGNKYSPQFFFVTADITGRLYLTGDVQNIFPGDHVTVKVRLQKQIAMYLGQNVTLREGGRTIATMKITEIGVSIDEQ